MRFILALFALALANRADALSMDVVLSHYDEPVPPIIEFINKTMSLMPQVGRYNVFLIHHHSEGNWSTMFPEAWTFIDMPNFSREEGSYLYYLKYMRDRRSDLVLFSHAYIDKDLRYLGNRFYERLPLVQKDTGFLALGVVMTCYCSGCQGWRLPHLREVFAITQKKFCEEGWWWQYGGNGRFVVSRKRIMEVEPWVYDFLYQYIQHVHEEDGKLPKDVLHNDISGENHGANNFYTITNVMERAWSLVFQCVQLTDDCCPGGVCSQTACQCLDKT